MSVNWNEIGILAPECIEHEANGLLVPRGDARALADAVNKLEQDRAFAARLMRGRPPVPTIEEAALRIEKVYRECLAELVREEES